MGNLRMNADQISYKGGEKPMSVEEAIKNAGNTGLAHTADIAPDFSAESAYNAGDLVYHNGTLYVFTANHAAGAWSTADTQVVTVGGEIATLTGEAADLYSGKANQITIAPFFSENTAYDPGDLVYYNGQSYRCVNAHEGAWDADDFAATTIAGEIAEVKSGLTNVAKYTSNANGEAWQFDSGLMICKKTVTQAVAWTAWGALYESDSIDFGSFPVAFTAIPVVNVSANNSGTSGISTGATGVTTTAVGSGKVVRPTDPGSQAVTVGIVAVGRWK